MTETTRTTVTLTPNYMDKIEELVGAFATTKAQVISKIVEKFFDSPENLALIENLRKEKKKKEDQRIKEEAKNPALIDKRITNVLTSANKIPIDSFLTYLKIDIEFFYDNLPKLKEKYKIRLVNNKIIKIK